MTDPPFDIHAPPIPDAADCPRFQARWSLRYEDVSQDGRLLVDGLPLAIGAVVWGQALVGSEVLAAMDRDRTVPILSRLVLLGGASPISAVRRVSGEGGYRLAHERDASGDVARIFMNAWVDVSADRARTHGGPIDAPPVAIHAGSVFAEHVFTRPFGPVEARKVTSLNLGGRAMVPAALHASARVEALLALPGAARAIDAELTAADAPFVFGRMHTDSNQHVNSLVYPRLFEEAVLTRVAQRAIGGDWLCRRLEIAYRRPCFAGESVRVWLRLARVDERLFAQGVVAGADEREPWKRPRAVMRMLLEA